MLRRCEVMLLFSSKLKIIEVQSIGKMQVLLMANACPNSRKIPEGGHWAKAKTCAFLHERCNYSHVTSSNWTQPSFKLMLTL